MTTCYKIESNTGVFAVVGGNLGDVQIYGPGQCGMGGYLVDSAEVLLVGENSPRFPSMLALAVAGGAGLVVPEKDGSGVSLFRDFWRVGVEDNNVARVFHGTDAQMLFLTRDGKVVSRREEAGNFYVEYDLLQKVMRGCECAAQEQPNYLAGAPDKVDFAQHLAESAGLTLPERARDGEVTLRRHFWRVEQDSFHVVRIVHGSEPGRPFYLTRGGGVTDQRMGASNFKREYDALLATLVAVSEQPIAGQPNYQPGAPAATDGHYNPTDEMNAWVKAVRQLAADALALAEALPAHTLDVVKRGNPERARSIAIRAAEDYMLAAVQVVTGRAELPAPSGWVQGVIRKIRERFGRDQAAE